MHHLYPLAKGDPLCPLGFHPQVRWPTRCKRCFRDYKEHGGRKKDEDLTVSSPSLATWNSASSRSRDEEPSPIKEPTVRGWVSSQNLNQDSAKDKTEPFSTGFARISSSWTSTPDLSAGGISDDTKAVTISLTLPRKRPTPVDTGQNTAEAPVVTLRRPAGTPPPTPAHLMINKNDSLAERVRKMQALKAHSNSFEKEASAERERDTNKKEIPKETKNESVKTPKVTKPSDNSKENDVNFLIKVKSARKNATRPPLRGGPTKELVNGGLPKDSHSDREDSDSNQEDDNLSSAGTSTTETTLVDHNNLDYQQIESLKEEVEVLRKRCERVEKEKSDILLRRLASLDTPSSKSPSRPSEMLKLQQKINELTIQNEDLKDEKKHFQARVREFESEIENRPSADTAARTVEQLRSKLLAAETLCEELMDENEDMKRELRSMEEEIEEMQDNFREDQADEYSSLRKELEQTTKNCRVLSFKLKKTERKSEQLEQEKMEHEKKLLELAGGAAGLDRVAKIKQLEQELAMSNEVALRLQRELQEANARLSQQPPANQKKAPTLANIGKSQSSETRPSRATLTRGGSQEDPQKLLRDLQDSLEREADLREQLKNAEEEASWYRERHGGGRLSPSLGIHPRPSPFTHPDLIPSSRSVDDFEEEVQLVDQNTAQRLHVLHMQLALGKQFGSLDMNNISGVNLRKKASRLEDDNETLGLQLKKMATKARTRKLSPTAPTNRLTIEAVVEKDEGISDEEDPAELRILLELNEQEASVLRRKVEELEHEGESLKTQLKEMAEKLTTANLKPTSSTLKKTAIGNKGANLSEEKIKILEDEIADIRKKLIEKERDCERLHAELSLTQKRSKTSMIKSKSLDGANEQQNVDLKRQLQLIEQEASVLTAKNQVLEADFEKLQAENTKLQLLRGAKTLKTEKSIEQNAEKIVQLESELQEAHSKIKELEVANSADKSEKRVSFGTATSKKDADALKAKQEELDKTKLVLKKVETEKDHLAELLKQLKDEAIKTFKPRTPKKPTDFTTKIALKKMVEDLENEIGEMMVIMKNADVESVGKKQLEMESMEKSIQELRNTLSKNETEMKNDKQKLQTDIEKLKEMNNKYEKEKKSLSDKYAICEKERDQAKDDYKKMQESNKRLDEQIAKLNNDLKSSNFKNSESTDLRRKIDELKMELDSKDKQVIKMKKDLETAERTEEDKQKLLKEVGDKAKKILELERKLKESEDKCKRTEKMLSVRKERVAKLEKELSEEKEQNENNSENQRRLSVEWLSERDNLQLKVVNAESSLESVETSWKDKLAELEGKVVTLESQLAVKNAHIKQLEESMSSDKTSNNGASQVELAQVKELLDTTRREVAIKEQELATMKQESQAKQQELAKAQDDLAGSRQNILKLQHENKELDTKVKAQTKEAGQLQSKISELDVDFQGERKRLERMKVIHDKDLKNKEIELATLKGKLRTLEQTSGAGSKKIEDLKKEYEIKFKQMESNLAAEKKEYDELTSKYEILEEEHVVTKAKLTIEKETAQSEVMQLQREINTATAELKSLQDTYNAKTDAWIKEKMDLQDKLSSLEERLCGGGWEVDKARLTARLQQKEQEMDHITKERDVSNHLQEALKRETEELRKKLDDYDKVTKVHRNLTMDNSNMEQEIKALQNRLALSDKAKKTEVAECKLRYEGQMQSIQEELQSVQTQVSRFKRERDMYKQMLDGAHKTMAEMRANSGETIIRNNNRSSNSSIEELEDYKSRVANLQQQMACLEDGLCEARMEASRARTELVSERSTAEIRLSEMQSKLNEFEEERLVASGRTKIPGLRTRLELAWHKEREDQQRLLQETSTLARDLRQTLFEVERERDKEKLDMKRRIDQLKKSAEEETDENKKKVTELQCDLLELRDAHAKLRTTNEKLRREKERHDREREQHKMSMASLKRSQQDEDRKISYLLELVDELTKMSPEALERAAQEPQNVNNYVYVTPTPPRRNRSKSRSREATPEENVPDSGLNPLTRLKLASQDVRAVIQSDRQRRQANMRRATSNEPSGTIVTTVTPRSTNGRPPSLKKRSLSLEQTTQEQGKIWKTDDDSMSSLQSLDTEVLDSSRHYTMQRDTSLDSRLSGGSTQSDVLPASEKKKKKGIFGKLKRLTKSRSIDDTDGPEVAEFTPIGSQVGSDSDMSAVGSKRDLRGRISDMFSRKGGAGSSSSSVGKERSKELSTPVASRSVSLQRPLSRNGSSTQIARASPASDIGTQSRAMSVTPGLQRKAK